MGKPEKYPGGFNLSKMKRLAINLVLLIVSLFFVLLLGEGAARIFITYQGRRIVEAHRENVLTRPAALNDIYIEQKPEGYGNKPDFSADWWGIEVHTDSLGCRVGTAAPDDARVILFIGDSMVFGLGVDDSLTIPNLVQQRLNAALPDKPCRVVNAGVIGYDFLDYMYSVQRFAPVVKPSLILIGICNNDWGPSEDPFGNVLALRGKAPARREAAPPPRRRHTPLWFAQKAFGMVYNGSALRSLIQQSTSRWQLANQHKNDYAVLTEGGAAEATARVDEGIRLFQETGIPYAFVYFPEFTNLGKPGDFIYARLLKERHQPLLDLALDPELSLESYFFVEFRKSGGAILPQSHFCPIGSRQVAKATATWVVEQGLWK